MTSIYRFGPFKLDIAERRLLLEEEILHLPGKVFDTLVILVRNHGLLVRKEVLMKAVWPDSVVEGNNLDHNISFIRRVLGTRGGRCIETVPRQGYRFVAAVELSGIDTSESTAPRRNIAPAGEWIVERESQFAALRAAVARANSGERQVIFVTGEPGIGKTTLVRAFAGEVARGGKARVARGDCLNRRGEGEPYMPILEALGRLSRDDDGTTIGLLAKYAPSWLSQLPAAAARDHARLPQHSALGVTTERMLREMTEGIEFLTGEKTLLLLLEDLHWADYSTVDLLTRIAQRTEPARLCVLGTYRPADARAQSHQLYPKVQEMKLRDQCREMPLALLSQVGVARYVGARFGGALPAGVACLLHEHTRGNPLFMTTVVNSWVTHGSVKEKDAVWNLRGSVEELSFGAPEGLREVIEHELVELDALDQEVIEAASVAGPEFSPAAVAAALDRSDHEIEARCDALARAGRFISASGTHEWPDGTICERYAFFHNVHRDVVYDRLPAGRRVRIHQQIAARLERGYRDREDEIAAELATHFSEARDAPRGMHYLRRAAEQALARSAHREAIVHLENAIKMLPRLPEVEERERRELDLLSMLVPSLVVTKGFADPDAERVLQRAYDLSGRLDGREVRFPIVFLLVLMLEIRGHYRKSQQLMERHFPDVERSGKHVPEAHALLACSRFHQGAFADALEQGQRGASVFSEERSLLLGAGPGEDPGTDARTWAALSLWFLGYADRALGEAELAVSQSRDPSRMYSLANALTQLAMIRQLRQEEEKTLALADDAIALAGRQGFPYRRAVGQVLRGWALARLGQGEAGVRELQEGIYGCAAAGAALDYPYHLSLLAEAQLLAGRKDRALAVLEEAIACVQKSSAFFYEAELQRLRGVIAFKTNEDVDVVEKSLASALQISRSQGSLSLELRAALSSATLSLENGESKRGRECLAEVYGRFTEGFGTPDMLQASRLLTPRRRQGTTASAS
jgi:DNA-binding winged helix-turn-helix (wHTH) protein/tetratricopeptide (TPR) repeat protein